MGQSRDPYHFHVVSERGSVTAGLQRAHCTYTTGSGVASPAWPKACSPPPPCSPGQWSLLCPARTTAFLPPSHTLRPQRLGVSDPEAVHGALCSSTVTDLLPHSCDSRAAEGSLHYHRHGDTQSLQARQLSPTNIFSPLILVSAEIDVYQQLSTNTESYQAQSQCIHSTGRN